MSDPTLQSAKHVRVSGQGASEDEGAESEQTKSEDSHTKPKSQKNGTDGIVGGSKKDLPVDQHQHSAKSAKDDEAGQKNKQKETLKNTTKTDDKEDETSHKQDNPNHVKWAPIAGKYTAKGKRELSVKPGDSVFHFGKYDHKRGWSWVTLYDKKARNGLGRSGWVPAWTIGSNNDHGPPGSPLKLKSHDLQAEAKLHLIPPAKYRKKSVSEKDHDTDSFRDADEKSKQQDAKPKSHKE